MDKDGWHGDSKEAGVFQVTGLNQCPCVFCLAAKREGGGGKKSTSGGRRERKGKKGRCPEERSKCNIPASACMLCVLSL